MPAPYTPDSESAQIQLSLSDIGKSRAGKIRCSGASRLTVLKSLASQMRRRYRHNVAEFACVPPDSFAREQGPAFTGKRCCRCSDGKSSLTQSVGALSPRAPR
jgi:hypothetical protein